MFAEGEFLLQEINTADLVTSGAANYQANAPPPPILKKKSEASCLQDKRSPSLSPSN